jgi:hypothetical protein
MRRLIGVAVVLLLGVLFSALLYTDYVVGKFGECDIVRLTDVPSPDGSKSVVTYRKECGATVPDSTHASIVSSGAPFSPESAAPFFSVRGLQDIQAAWIGEQTVRVGLIPGANTFYKRNQYVGNIRIEYE